MIETDTNVLDSLGLSGGAATQASTGGNKDLGRTDFLELMLAQIRHQNPLSPMDGEEFVAQLAQFSTVQGVETLNESFNSVAAALQSNQLLQASGLVGQDVLIPSDTGYLAPDTGLTGRVELASPVPDLTVKFFDKSGELVRTLALGAQDQGSIEFTWEGLDASGSGCDPGLYRIVAEGAGDDGTSRFDTYAEFPVEGVIPSKDGGSVMLSLRGMGEVPLDGVLEIH
jgi:flagellar basal-body rod modification protein FlgD